MFGIRFLASWEMFSVIWFMLNNKLDRRLGFDGAVIICIGRGLDISIGPRSQQVEQETCDIRIGLGQTGLNQRCLARMSYPKVVSVAFPG